MARRTWQEEKASFKYAFHGIRTAWKSEFHLRIHLFFTLAVPVFGFMFSINLQEWALLIICIGLVWVAELLNTAFEKLCDKVEPEQDSLIKEVKDVASGAVLLASVTAVVVGLLIFLPKIFVC